MEDKTLDQWLNETHGQREALIAYSKSLLPADASERHGDSDKLLQSISDAENFVAEAESYLSDEKEKAMFAAIKDHSGLSAKEREVISKAAVRGIQLVVDSLKILARTLNNRKFWGMNVNRSR